MKRMRIWTAVLALAGAAGPFPAVSAQDAAGFERQPVEAAPALKATVGKPFNAGYVFVDGKYVKPPYKVERYGTVIRINGIQVTNPVVPWEEFVKTQSGVTVTKSEVPVEAAPEPEPEPEEEEPDFDAGDDDSESSLDDLFDDEPAPKKKKAAKPKRRAVPRPKKPTVTVSYSMEGDFVPNERSRALVARINAMRTRIDGQLRKGGYFCFGSRYASVSGDASAAGRIMAKLPDVMRKNADREAFGTAMRQAGLTFFPLPLVDDLFRNRFDYFRLSERRKAEQEKNRWQSLLGPTL